MTQDRQKGVQALCDIMEAVEKRKDSQVWREIEFALHRELTDEQNLALAREFVEDQIASQGILAQLNFHFDTDEETGEPKPHCHVALATRRLEENGLSSKKAREWNSKSFLLNLREQWAQYSNFYLKLYGHDVRIDHRSYKDQGIDIEPQPKRGRNILEQEKRARNRETRENKTPDKQNRLFSSEDKDKRGRGLEEKETERHEGKGGSKEQNSQSGQGSYDTLLSYENSSLESQRKEEKDHSFLRREPPPVTGKGKAFREVQLRNLYRILRNPELIFEMVTKHHTTFMWADVQKKLHQYVDELALFQRVEAKLRNSKELLLLISDEKSGDIYTTHSLLKAEKILVKTAEELGCSQTHGVQSQHI